LQQRDIAEQGQSIRKREHNEMPELPTSQLQYLEEHNFTRQDGVRAQRSVATFFLHQNYCNSFGTDFQTVRSSWIDRYLPMSMGRFMGSSGYVLT
jgi:hypothetical protein